MLLNYSLAGIMLRIETNTHSLRITICLWAISISVHRHDLVYMIRAVCAASSRPLPCVYLSELILISLHVVVFHFIYGHRHTFFFFHGNVLFALSLRPIDVDSSSTINKQVHILIEK